AVAVERALLAARGGGCHQRFGATQLEWPELGTLLYVREAPAEAQLRWTPAVPLPEPRGPVQAWDGSGAERAPAIPRDAGVSLARERAARTHAIFIAHARALPDGLERSIGAATHVYAPGVSTWAALAARGLWVEGCSEGLGIGALEPLLREPLLQ